MVARHALAQRRTARNCYAGLFHRLITYGFIISHHRHDGRGARRGLRHSDDDARGRFYLYFQSFVVDLFGALVMVGIGMHKRATLPQAPEESGLHERGDIDSRRDLPDVSVKDFDRRLAHRGDKTTRGARGRRSEISSRAPRVR